MALASKQGKQTSAIYALYTGGVSSVLVGGKGSDSTDALAKVKNCKIATFPAGTQAYYAVSYYDQKLKANCQPLPRATPDAMAGAVKRGDAAGAVASYGTVAPTVGGQECLGSDEVPQGHGRGIRLHGQP